MLTDIEGKTMPALDIFAMAIRHIRACLIDDVKSREPDVKPETINWVVTVPAIWSDAAKQFMREAGVMVSERDHCRNNFSLHMKRPNIS